MKLVTRSHRVLAVLMGIAVLAILIFQILKDGQRLEFKSLNKIESIKK